MRRAILIGAVLASGCSLIVPNPSDYTPDLREDDAGPIQHDAGRDAGRDSGTDAGTDAGPACEAGLTECDGECVDTESSLDHCGACGNACAATDVCRAGECFDPPVEVDAGPEHTCVRRASGAVWCWGSNVDGQLGNGTVMDSNVPVLVADLPPVIQVAAGGFTFRGPNGLSCGLVADGTVLCWGNNSAGQLGDGTTSPRTRPVVVSGLPPAREVATGFSDSCAVTTTHQLYCWGSSGVAPHELHPVSLLGGWAETVEMGAQQGCAVSTTDGDVYCWGSNFNGQLGDGTTTDREDPTRVLDVSNAIDVSASAASCALLEPGEVMCWGLGRALGVGRTDATPEPMPMRVTALADVIDIDGAPFGATTCAVHGADRRVACWGWDLVEGVRTGSFPDAIASTPVEISGLSGVTSIAVGGVHACAVLSDGTLRCWGSNSNGQLGNGTNDDSAELVEVALP